MCARELINNQFNVLIRFRNLLSLSTKCHLYNAFILPHFFYCSAIWHFCGARNSDKLDQLNKRVLRIVFNDRTTPYDNLLKNIGSKSLHDRWIQDILILTYKSLNNFSDPKYISELLTLRSTGLSLTSANKLTLSRVNTTNFGHHSSLNPGITSLIKLELLLTSNNLNT